MVDLCVGGWTPYEGLATVAYCSHVLGMAALGLAIEFALDNLQSAQAWPVEIRALATLARPVWLSEAQGLSRVGVPYSKQGSYLPIPIG